jgi:hypothetical protein
LLRDCLRAGRVAERAEVFSTLCAPASLSLFF